MSNNKYDEFLEYYLKYNDSLSKFVKAMVKNSDEAKDIIQETLLTAMEKFDSIKHKEAFLSFIFTIAKRIYTTKKWRNRFFSYFEDNEDDYIGYSSPPDLNIDVTILYQALDKLPPKMKEAVVLFEISGFSLNEIVEIQGGTLSGVKSRIKRGREQLKEILTKIK